MSTNECSKCNAESKYQVYDSTKKKWSFLCHKHLNLWIDKTLRK